MTVGSVGEVLALYKRFGADPYDEELSQLDHGLQTAALAVDAGASDTLVAAALLHDVGHLLHLEQASRGRAPTEPDVGHEATGARYLAGLFPPSVTGPIALHVRAKRYLCATEPRYEAQLSDGSKRSLQRQGGPMADVEISTFEQHPGFEAAVLLRAWDDRGKVDGLAVAPLETFRDLLDRTTTA